MKKTININGGYLGAVKQLPFLLRELNKMDSNLPINVITYDFDPAKKIKNILKKDLEYEGIKIKNLKIFNQYIKGNYEGMEVYPSLTYSDLKQEFFSKNYLRLHIDPLKFEKRRILNKEEIQSLRKKYLIDSDNVILGGSLNSSECNLVAESAKEILLENPHSQIIFAPRENPDKIMQNLKREGIKFRTDKDILRKKSSYLVITEKGILDKLYSICDIAIIGDSFGEFSGGGQNPLEPAFYGKYILSGKRNRNNEEAYNGLEKSGLLKRINSDELTEKLLEKPLKEKLRKSQENAKKFIEFNQGSAKVYAEIIYKAFEGNINLSEATEKILSLNFYNQNKFSFEK